MLRLQYVRRRINSAVCWLLSLRQPSTEVDAVAIFILLNKRGGFSVADWVIKDVSLTVVKRYDKTLVVVVNK